MIKLHWTSLWCMMNHHWTLLGLRWSDESPFRQVKMMKNHWASLGWAGLVRLNWKPVWEEALLEPPKRVWWKVLWTLLGQWSYSEHFWEDFEWWSSTECSWVNICPSWLKCIQILIGAFKHRSKAFTEEQRLLLQQMLDNVSIRTLFLDAHSGKYIWNLSLPVTGWQQGCVCVWACVCACVCVCFTCESFQWQADRISKVSREVMLRFWSSVMLKPWEIQPISTIWVWFSCDTSPHACGTMWEHDRGVWCNGVFKASESLMPETLSMTFLERCWPFSQFYYQQHYL